MSQSKNTIMDLTNIPELQHMSPDEATSLLGQLDGVRAYLMSMVQGTSASKDTDTFTDDKETSPLNKSLNGILEREIREIEDIIDGKAEIDDTALATETTIVTPINVDTALTVGAIPKQNLFDKKRQITKALVTIEAPVYEPENRAPIDLVVVVDRSMSMEGDRISLVLKTLKFIISQLAAEDRLAVVSYGSDVKVVMDLTTMTSDNKEKAECMVDQIRCDGNTNLCGGLVKAVDLFHENTENQADVRSVLLLTDGQANQGYTDVESIMRACVDPEFAARYYEYQPFSRSGGLGMGMLRRAGGFGTAVGAGSVGAGSVGAGRFGSFNSSLNHSSVATTHYSKMDNNTDKAVNTNTGVRELGCTINTFGFGRDHDSKMLSQIAELGRGIFYYIENTDGISQAFADCLGGLISTTSKDLSIRVTPMDGATIRKVYTKFTTKSDSDGSTIIQIPDMQSDEKREILFDIDLPDCRSSEHETVLQNVVQIRVKYFDTIAEVEREAEHTLIVERPEGTVAEPPNLRVDRANNREIATSSIETVTDLASKGEVSTAKVILASAIEAITRSPSHSDPLCEALVAELLEFKERLENRGYTPALEHSLTSTMATHAYQRSAGTQNASATTYITSSRAKAFASRDVFFDV